MVPFTLYLPHLHGWWPKLPLFLILITRIPHFKNMAKITSEIRFLRLGISEYAFSDQVYAQIRSFRLGICSNTHFQTGYMLNYAFSDRVYAQIRFFRLSICPNTQFQTGYMPEYPVSEWVYGQLSSLKMSISLIKILKKIIKLYFFSIKINFFSFEIPNLKIGIWWVKLTNTLKIRHSCYLNTKMCYFCHYFHFCSIITLSKTL